MFVRVTIAIAALWWAATAAIAQHVEVGTLTCTLVSSLDGRPSEPGPAAAQPRDATCHFKSTDGVEEAYGARVRGVGETSKETPTIIWLVKSQTEAKQSAGFLEQTYAPDAKAAREAAPPLIGETNSNLVLSPMTEHPEGRASTPDRSAPPGYVVVEIALKLKAAAG
jgi:hypothetical protein